MDADKSELNGEALLKECETFAEKGRIFDAMRGYAKLQTVDAAIFAAHKEKAEEVRTEALKLQDLIFRMDQTSRWTYLGHDEYGVVYKDGSIEMGQSEDALLIDGLVSAPLFHMLLLMNEVPFYPKWLPFMEESLFVSPRKSIAKADVWWQIRSPFPSVVSHRDACVSVHVYDCLSEERPTVYIRMADMRSPAVRAKCKDQVERIAIRHILFRLQPVGAESVRVTGMGRVDVCMRYVPHFMLNWVASRVCRRGLGVWATEAQALSRKNLDESILSDSLKENAEMYSYLRERLRETFQNG